MNVSLSDSLRDFLSSVKRDRLPSRRMQIGPSVSDLMSEIQSAELASDYATSSRLTSTLSNPNKVPVKLLCFHLDVRPGYYGTWTKTSGKVSPKNPFKMDDEVLDYGYDSEAEWEKDPEDVENLNSENEEDDSEMDEDDEDGWLGRLSSPIADP